MSQSKIPPEQLLALFQKLIEEMPAFARDGHLSLEEQQWLGRAEALLAEVDPVYGLTDFRTARGRLKTLQHSRDRLLSPVVTGFAKVELLAPPSAQGAFIPPGDTWNGYAALVRLLQRECSDLLLVDAYIDASLFIDFAPHAVPSKGMRCLTLQGMKYHQALIAAAGKWSRDAISAGKPVELRYAPAGSLHDRLIILDRSEVWLISQSLKDIAKRSPATVTRADDEIGRMKADHYQALWEASSEAK